MKIFTATQIQALDKATIEKEPIASIDLMERAAMTLADFFIEKYQRYKEVFVFAGNGNNGGDALVLARLLSHMSSAWTVSVFVLDSENRSPDNQANIDCLLDVLNVKLKVLFSEDDIPEIPSDAVVVDGLFGTGLSRAVTGMPAAVIERINASEAEVLSVDIPSGLYAENNAIVADVVVKADKVLSFQFPKLAFMLSDSEPYIKEWFIRDIGLHKATMEAMETPFSYFQQEDAEKLWRARFRFSHKGTYGHALLVAGKRNMMGAAILATKACMRSGTGLVTTHIPHNSGHLLQSTVPEALLSEDRSELMFTDELDYGKYSAVAVGPAIGTKPNAQHALLKLIQTCDKPLVMDADALNILSLNKEWMAFLPENTILTPHPGEFDRLTQKHASAYERLMTQIEFAHKWQVVVVLKGAFTSVVFPDGSCFFNSTGHHGMASGGCGDVLTGIVLGLLAQGYSCKSACLLGVWWHGKAADLYAENHLAQSLIASDVIDYMGHLLSK